MPLITDHRPEDFDDFVGNESLIASLQSKLDLSAKKRPHVYLFVGDKGCGKTTLARITSNYLDCSEFEFSELDASDKDGGVDAMRELKRTIKYPPMEGDVRVWFIDEVHNMSAKAQDNCLKLLEEPPEHAYFIFATTDPQKLTKTFKDRCQIYEVKALDSEEMESFLKDIVKREKANLPKEVLRKIVNDSQGHPRAALSLLEKVIDLPEKEMLKSLDKMEQTEKAAIDLARLLLKPKVKWTEIAKVLRELKTDVEETRLTVLGYCGSILISGKDDAQAGLIMNCFKEPFFNTGKTGMNGLALACYEAICG